VVWSMVGPIASVVMVWSVMSVASVRSVPKA
jgi:hypothetical protein